MATNAMRRDDDDGEGWAKIFKSVCTMSYTSLVSPPVGRVESKVWTFAYSSSPPPPPPPPPKREKVKGERRDEGEGEGEKKRGRFDISS